MDATSVLKIVGQVAGIGGVALGVLLMIFRDVIQKNIFPNLAQIQAYRIIRLIVVLTFLIAASGIGAWVYLQKAEGGGGPDQEFPKQSPEPTMLRHMELVDQNKFSEAWRLMSREAHKRFQYDFIEKAYTAQRVPLGAVIERKIYNVSTLKQLPDQTRGAFAVAYFISTFEKRMQYIEAVTAMAEDGEWKVLFHQLAPCEPSICKPSSS